MVRYFAPMFAALALTAGANLAHAQFTTGPGAGPAPAMQPAPNAKQITPDVLLNHLRQKGYNVQQVKGTDGRPILNVQIEKDGWKYAVTVEFMPNLQSYYLLCHLGKVGSGNSSAQLAELLKANNKLAPAYFSIWPDGRLCLEDYYGSQADSAVFQNNLDRFLGKIRESHPLWDSSRWPVQGIAQAK